MVTPNPIVSIISLEFKRYIKLKKGLWLLYAKNITNNIISIILFVILTSMSSHIINNIPVNIDTVDDAKVVS